MANKISNIYKVTFYNQGTVYEIYAKQVDHGAIYGFLEVSELIFGSTTHIVVDPSEERLKTEFSGVKKTYIPIHAVLRIDEVEKEGVAKIRETDKKSNIAQFPIPVYTPDPGSK
jgi:hypothetical protein